jgi:NAD(P)-dependent dehydrogenase (short-subunit alcohol dehydrogenase family)
MRGLIGKRIIVVGGANGIGAATAERLVEEGAIALIGDIDATALDITVCRVREKGDAHGLVFDVADPASVDWMISSFASQLGGIDGLANVAVDAASSHREVAQDILEMDAALWARTFQVNTIGYALTIKAVIPYLKAAGGGSIVNVSSTAGFAASPTVPAYSASKGGVHAVTRHVALVFGRDGIRCNCVAPGWILTASNEQGIAPEERAKALRGIPLRRIGAPGDIAAAITFLMSDDAAWMTGQLLAVNGGTNSTA